MRNAAASRPLRYSRSFILSSNTGGLGMFIFTLAFSAPASWVDSRAWRVMGGAVSVAVGGAMLLSVCSTMVDVMKLS